MRIVKLIGGLGNQMFQYAFYLSLQENFKNEDILIDLSNFSTYKLHNGFEINRVFGIKINQADYALVKKYSWNRKNYYFSRLLRKLLPNKKTEYIELDEFVFDSNIFITDKVYFEGYWQNENYFANLKENVRSSFKFPEITDSLNLKTLDLIKKRNSVSIHIRRGDYLNHNLYRGICDLEYYTKAIKYIYKYVDSPSFFIFSNDIEWCKLNLINLFNDNDYEFVAQNKGETSFIDMHLMSLCKHNIIANSSFSWWGTWLNNNPTKITIAPQKWLNRELKSTIQLPEWIIM